LIRIQQEDFDLSAEYAALRDKGVSGAIVTFVGLVREITNDESTSSLFLEHYPGMTEKVLEQLESEARSRWQLSRVSIIHRVGQLAPGDQIVFVGVSSLHRAEAFAAAEFLMDILKTRAPFWKKEQQGKQAVWVEARAEDEQRASNWKAGKTSHG